MSYWLNEVLVQGLANRQARGQRPGVGGRPGGAPASSDRPVRPQPSEPGPARPARGTWAGTWRSCWQRGARPVASEPASAAAARSHRASHTALACSLSPLPVPPSPYPLPLQPHVPEVRHQEQQHDGGGGQEGGGAQGDAGRGGGGEEPDLLQGVPRGDEQGAQGEEGLLALQKEGWREAGSCGCASACSYRHRLTRRPPVLSPSRRRTLLGSDGLPASACVATPQLPPRPPCPLLALPNSLNCLLPAAFPPCSLCLPTPLFHLATHAHSQARTPDCTRCNSPPVTLRLAS